ncbi:MAG TPA: cyanophycinase [Gemmatimonadales bacterium]
MRATFLGGVAIGLLGVAGAAGAQAPAAPKYGPARGALVIVGGNLHDPALYAKFIELMGGPAGSLLVIPTAGDVDTFSNAYAGLKPWRDAGATNVAVLHTRNHDIANADTFVAHIRSAKGVFFEGGRQWKLADAYLNTKVQTELNALLQRGGVIGGSSAGATIQGSFMVRGDTKGNQIMVGDHTVALGFLKNAAIDQHVLVRNRVYDLIPVIQAHPEMLGIGIDENTAIVVRGDSFDVYGESHVMIYDHHHTFGADGKFYFLSKGDRYNMATRTPTRPGGREGENFFAALKAEEWN